MSVLITLVHDMLRFIFRRTVKDEFNGLETTRLVTLDIDVPEVENVLTRGGSSEAGYDFTDIEDIEVLPQNKSSD